VRGAVLALAVVAAVGGVWWMSRATPPAASTAAPRAAAVSTSAPAALSASLPKAPGAAARDPASFGAWIAQHSSLRGTQLDGAWDIDARGQLHPTLALRRRFDQLLTLRGETDIADLGAYISHAVREQAGNTAAQQVAGMWQKYLTLQQHSFTTHADARDRQTWAAALAERQQARRQILGPEVAAAFYADDEAQLQALMQGRTEASPNTGIDRRSLSADALERLKQEDAAWADWERRLAETRREVAALQAAPELSDLQRRQSIDRLLAQRFDTSEAIRVRALLQLPVV
jgi:lipase chaperone LimK